MRKGLIILCGLLWLHVPVQAQDDAPPVQEAVPQPPDIPGPIRSGEAIEPEVTIIRTEESTVEEYRINGSLYMVKITPAVGRPYYLIDQNGDGNLETRRNSLGGDVVVPQWILFEW
ncbi:MAG: DUF2782 domain-containing protein [Gammaproteobacteria bacterium]